MGILRDIQNSSVTLKELENLLAESLTPVKPRIEFVSELRQHLFDPVIRKRYLESVEWLILITISLFSVFILFFIGIRSVVMILSALGIIREYNKRKRN